jgi:type IX secretion system PorP/SprF family membrane protein
MKKLLAVIAAGCLSTLALAQQDPQFSQNMYNRLYVNPAYAGSSEAICAHLLYRSQWVNYDGAPKTGVLAIDAPLANNKVGVGLSVMTDKIGAEKTLQGKLAGNYKFTLGQGKLGAGIDLDFMQHQIDGADFKAPDPSVTDPSIPKNSVSGTAFDLGAGLYYNTDKLYVGVSATHMLEAKVDLDNFSKEYKRHIYGMIGYTFELTPTVALKPMVFVKTVTGNTTMDFNINAHFNERFWVGVSYRNEDAIVGLLGMNITDKLKVGYSYDFTTSDVKDYSDGTHEIMLGYCFNVKKRIPVSIRNVRFL